MLEVKNVDAGYGSTVILQDVSLHVEPGEVVTIVGANGAGKTTLLRTISGLVTPRTGSITFEGRDITRLAAHETVDRGVTLIPEGRQLFPDMTVRDNLLMGAYSRHARDYQDDTLHQVLELFPRLRERLDQHASSLSGGEQQMVAIGRALMSNPRLILMDEISLGLAPIVVNQIYRSLPDISAAGTTVLLVEQDLNRALSVSDHVTCLLEGHVELAGVSREIDRQALIDAYFGASQ